MDDRISGKNFFLLQAMKTATGATPIQVYITGSTVGER